MNTTMTDPKHVFQAASDFRIGSRILEQQFGQRVFPLRATVVTGAFAIELYLKCLSLLMTKAIPKVHALVELYDRLPQETRATVEENYRSISSRGTIREVFIAHNSTFLDWRYIFEKQEDRFTLDFVTLRDACTALHNATLELSPSWRTE